VADGPASDLTRSDAGHLLIMKAIMIDPKADAFFKTPQRTPALSEYQTEQLAIQKNRERLKAERLARESNPSQ
jgi:hypothetical protein